MFEKPSKRLNCIVSLFFSAFVLFIYLSNLLGQLSCNYIAWNPFDLEILIWTQRTDRNWLVLFFHINVCGKVNRFEMHEQIFCFDWINLIIFRINLHWKHFFFHKIARRNICLIQFSFNIQINSHYGYKNGIISNITTYSPKVGHSSTAIESKFSI